VKTARQVTSNLRIIRADTTQTFAVSTTSSDDQTNEFRSTSSTSKSTVCCRGDSHHIQLASSSYTIIPPIHTTRRTYPYVCGLCIVYRPLLCRNLRAIHTADTSGPCVRDIQWRNFGQKSGGYKISFPSPFPFPSPFSPSHSTRTDWTSVDLEHTTTTIIDKRPHWTSVETYTNTTRSEL